MTVTKVFHSIIRISLLLLLINAVAAGEILAQGNFVMVTNADGEATSLRQKVVTKTLVKSRGTPSANAEGPNVLPYNIFFQLKTTSGQEEENGFLRIGDGSGKFVGWIEAKNVVKWSTRYVIQPRESDKPENRFKVETDAGLMEYVPEKVPEDASVYAFITGAPAGGDADEANGPFPVAMLTARIDAASSAAAELNAIEKMKLEVVFVIENTAFMSVEYDGITLHKRTVDMAQRFVDSYKGETGEIPTRFGLVCYQDSVSDATIPVPKVLQPLTENHSEWRNAIQRMVPLTARNDLPADGISALAKADSDAAGWSSNSTKHIVLLGNSALNDAVGGGLCSFHANNVPGKLERIFEVANAGLWKASNGAEWVGSNTSGISPTQLVQSFQAVGGSLGERMRKTRRLHAIRVGFTGRDRIAQGMGKSVEEADKLIDLINDAFVDMNDACATLSSSEIISIIASQSSGNIEALIWGAQIRNSSSQDRFAPQQYRNLTGGEGLFAEMQPTSNSVKITTENLRKKIQSAVDLIDQVAKDNVDMEGERNEFTTPIYKMVGSAKATLGKVSPVMEGVANLRNQQGRALGEKLVMVSKNELELLKSNFDSLYTTFRSKQKRSDRQDVGGILLDLQKLLASSASGQKIDANTDLRELITDLPLRTEALQITASDIAVMNTAAFDSWLEDLQLAKDAAQKQLDTGDWLRVNDRSNLEYGFLRLSSLP